MLVFEDGVVVVVCRSRVVSLCAVAVLCCVVLCCVVVNVSCHKHVVNVSCHKHVVNVSCRVINVSCEGVEWVVVWWVRTKNTPPTRI